MSDWSVSPGLRDILVAFAVVSALSLVAAAVLGLVLWRRLRRLSTTGGGFWQTLREVPFGLVVLLDLLDLGLDVFSAPIIWVLLKKLGLTALREVATVQALIPISAPIPTMTICWLLARARSGNRPLLGGGTEGPALEGVKVGPGRWRA
jgi:hypothetical protein